MSDTPIIRLRPGKGRRLTSGAPWAYADEIALDRRTKALPPGSIVVIEDTERRALGCGAFNPLSKIPFRLLDSDPGAVIDQSWLAARLRHALALREILFDAPFYRLIHAEADGLPGVIIDRFGDAAVIQPNAAWAERLLPDLAAALADVTGVTTILKNASGRARALEGLDETSTILLGEDPGLVPVPMNGAIYMADLTGGQKTGLFYDQRPNHAFVASLAKGAEVLDVFSHVGGFALASLAGGAASALAVDASAPALGLAEQGAGRMGLSERFTTRKGDAFDTMAALFAEGRRFDIVVCDPPAFAPHKNALAAGLRAYSRTARLGAALVRPGGFLCLCSCSHAADLPKFREASFAGIERAGRVGRLIHSGGAGPDHPVHPALAESSYLKALVLRLD